ncbi:hypothetical protein D3C79_804250 [compost metagenome]
MAANGVFITGAVDAHTVMAEAVPVAHDRREHRQQTVSLVVLQVEAQLRLQGAEYRATGTHHIHRMGGARNALEHFFQGLRYVAQGFELAFVFGQLGGTWQLTIEQQVRDFFKFGMFGQFTNIVATVG